jgi:hypothetical protein
MPKESLFRFSLPPNDPKRWDDARRMAASGDPILLKNILPHFPHYFDFLDGDTSMRIYHLLGDYFIDDNHGFEVLSNSHPGYSIGERPKTDVFGNAYHAYSWEMETALRVIPEPYNIKGMKRAPVIHVGYFAFDRKGSSSSSLLFNGKNIGEASIDREKFMRIWQKDKSRIDRPWIGLHSANENWGMFSTYFPNRTIDWGRCCSHPPIRGKMIQQLLDHPKTLLMLTNQHHNLTHPKLLTLPRGLPIHGDHSRRVIFDKMRYLASFPSKENLAYTASSNWGYRPKILECLGKKFDPAEAKFNLHKDRSLAGRVTPTEYYDRLGKSRFSIALPGLGYDTFRAWESLTFGTIPILEKGIGIDKTMWRLPALIVEDFDMVTPELLHMAYVEAIYRVKEFEFERLTQTFWWSFILNVSRTMSTETVLSKFPLESEDPTFCRPFERFTCHDSNSCGPGTKKIPKSFC